MTLYSGDWDKTGPVISNNNIKFLEDGSLGAMFNVFQRKQENYKRLLLKKQDLVFLFYLDMMLFMVLKQFSQLIWACFKLGS